MIRGRTRALLARLLRWAIVEDDGGNAGPQPWQQVRVMGQSGRSVAVYPYGFHAVSPAGSRALVGQVGGDAGNRAHFPTSPDDRPALKSGEVAVFHPATGSSVIFREDGSIEVDAVGDLKATAAGDATIVTQGSFVASAAGQAFIQSVGNAQVIAPIVTVTGNLIVTGTLSVTGASTFSGTITDSLGVEHTAHVHQVPFSTGPGDTQAPENP